MRHEASKDVNLSAAAALGLLLSCGSGAGGESEATSPLQPRDTAAEVSPASGETASDAKPAAAPEAAPATEAFTPGAVDFGDAAEPSKEVEVCAAVVGESELRRVYLAFALDVSGSMGSDAERFRLKWQPVIQASEAFFSEQDSAGLSASLTFFPSENGATRCSDASYMVPSVPQTLLPSAEFSNAITALALTPTSNWRTSTPTLAAFNGTAAGLGAIADPSPLALRAIVLVTDGVPQGCGADGSELPLLVDAVRNSGILTFVVGVGNPPSSGLVDNLANLNGIAEAGGTGQAFIVQTGDAAQTEADFKAVIDGIRGLSVACNIEIPLPPAGAQFVPERINVTYRSAGATDVALSYDAECRSTNSWRYDNPDAPQNIVLCDDTCGTAQRDVSAKLSVEFGCERRNVIR
jgi:von Willebrand factor type A domain